MGGICSTSSAHSGGHTVLSSSSSPGSTGPGRSRPVNEPDPGAAAAAAAERRAKNVRFLLLSFRPASDQVD